MLTAPARCSQVADTAADQAIPPAELLATAQQAHAHITMTPGAPHLSMISNPGLVTKAILEAHQVHGITPLAAPAAPRCRRIPALADTGAAPVPAPLSARAIAKQPGQPVARAGEEKLNDVPVFVSQTVAPVAASSARTVPSWAATAAPGALADLTAQQREIVTLASRGLTNGEIADRLFLSPRTVASHLYRSHPKLGIAGRHQLRDLLDQATGQHATPPPHGQPQPGS